MRPSNGDLTLSFFLTPSFNSLNEVREITEEWMGMYNGQRPHSSLGDKTPWEYLASEADLLPKNWTSIN